MRLPVYERRAGVSPLSMPQVQPTPQIGDNGQTAAKTLQGVFTRLEEIQNGMEDARTLELFNRFKMDSQEYHENPDRGIYNTRLGYHASGIYQEADQWLRKKGEDYARELPSRRAQFNFRKMAREHIQQRGMQNSRFEAEQMRRYQQETADATIKERLNYAESHWNDNAAIAEVRRDIQQALELKMRGSGKEAFAAAMADIEDQIGVARIRQAYTNNPTNPLIAVDMLTNPDIHLKADTRAKLVESLKNKTELYRLHGDVQLYTQQYSPQNAVELRTKLLERFGPKDGETIFQEVTRYWSVNNYQKQAQKQAERDTQKKNENEILDKWNMYLSGETDVMPDPQELNRDARSGEISYSFAHGILTQVLHKQDADKAAQAKAEKLKKDIERWSAENRGVFLTNEQMEQAVTSGYWTPEDARQHENARDVFTRNQEQEENKRLEDNKQNFLERFADGGVTEEMIDDAEKNKILKPSDAKTLRDYLRTEQQRLEAEQKQNLQEAERLKKKAQEQYQGAVRVVIGMGGRISRESATKLYEGKKIDQNFMQWLYGQEEQREREDAAAKKEQAKLQAAADKEAWKKNLDLIAQTYAMAHFKDEGAGLRKIGSQEFMPELSTEQRDHLIERFNFHSRAINLEAKNYKDKHEDFQKKMHNERMRLYEVHFNTREEIAQAYKTIQTLYDEPDGLDPQFYNEEKAILDRKSRELDKTQAEADKKKKATDEAAHKKKINQWGLEIYDLYKDSGKGEALSIIDRMNVDPDTRQKLHARVSTLFDDESQAVKDKREKIHQAHEETYSGMVTEILGRSLTDEQITQYRQQFIDKRKTGELEENRYNSLMQILDQQERANKQAAESKRKADNYDIAKEYFDRFGLDGQHEARDTIRKDYQDTRANEIMTLFDRLAQEKQEQQNDQDKAKRLQQDKTFQDLQVKYWREGNTIANEELAALEQSEGLRPDQIAQAHSTNWSMREKKGVAEQLAKNPNINFAGMTTEQQEALVSQHMGVSPEQRHDNVAYLFRKVLDGTSTNAEIESYRARAGIWDVDAERLREYEGKFARQQRERLGLYADSLSQQIIKLYSGPDDKASDTARIRNEAMLTFQTATSTIDPHSDKFEDRVKEIFGVILGQITEQYRASHTMEEWKPFKGKVPTPAGKRVEAAENTELDLPAIDRRIPITDAWGNTTYIQQDGTLVSGNAPVYMPPAPQPQPEPAPYDPRNNAAVNSPLMQRYSNPANHNFQQPSGQRLQGVVDTTKSILSNINYRISSGFSWKRTDLRNGRAHPAVDAVVPVGTPVHVPNYGTSWDVTKTGENKTAGKFVKIQTTLPSGDVHEYTLAHLDSVDVAVGDVVSSADVIAKSGDTGNSTGPHLHIGLKVNGQAVDPRSVDIGSDNGISGDTVPQQVQPVPPQVQQDPYADFWAILRDFSSGDVLFRSNDLFDTTGRFGGSY